ncbi:MATE family efflux transporter [Aliagarivorans taiwanensis]|uniref:MATE family efflux transporter n=1 Tax=Aliagarivorans taiwanensis TaxID=561966 RepID=UPI0004077BC7|nr:MATE family efflux transporter [Aliagarivorans taiwanensis]
MSAQSNTIDLTKDGVGKTLLRYALPSTMAVWVFALYTMVDGMFVGRGVGPEALAAVNLSLPFISIMFAFSILITIGAATVAGKQKGEGKHDAASRTFSTTLYALLAFGLTVCALSYLFIEELAYLLGARGELLPLVVEYLSTLLLFNSFYLVGYSMEVFAKVDGFPKRELGAICCAAVTNVVLDYLLVIQLDWGLRGAAIATGCAQLLQAGLLLLHFISRSGTIRFVALMPQLSLVARYVKIGLPDCLTEMSAGVVLLAFNTAILHYYGSSELSAFSVVGYINNFMLITMIGLTQGMQPIVTYSRGRGDILSIEKVSGLTLRSALAICVVSYLGIYLFGDVIASAFLDGHSLVEQSHHILRVFSLSFLFMGINVVTSGLFTALEATKRAGLLSMQARLCSDHVNASTDATVIWSKRHLVGGTGMRTQHLGSQFASLS